MQTQNRFLRIQEVAVAVGFKRSQIYKMMQQGAFPRPVKIGTSARWPITTVDAWMNLHIKQAG